MSEANGDDLIVQGRARAVMEWLIRNQATIDGQLTSSSAWLSGSLLALNGGAAVALTQLVDRVAQPRLSLGLLLAGLFFAMMSPVIIQSYAARVSPLAGQRILYWAGVVAGEPVDAEIDDALAEKIESWSWMSFAAPCAGWISGILFFSAIVSVAYGFDRDAEANDGRCAAVQNDMLSAHPRRADSLRLFEVLKCKPIGIGRVHAH